MRFKFHPVGHNFHPFSLLASPSAPISPSAFMASPNPEPSKSHPHQHEINDRQQQQRPNHHRSKPSFAWADLPPELVVTIIRRLPLEDHSTFGLACKPWWSAMLNARSLCKPPPLLILKPGNTYYPRNPHLSDPADRAIEAEATRFYAICEGGEHRMLPAIRLNPAARCCGSSMGWLLMVDANDESSANLFNPVSGERVELPALPTAHTFWRTDDVLCSKPASDQDFIVAVKGSMIDDARSSFVTVYRYAVFLACRPKDDDEWKIEIHYDYDSTDDYDCTVYTYALYEARLYIISGSGQGRMDIYKLDTWGKPQTIILYDGIWRMRDVGILLVVMDGKLCIACGAIRGPLHVHAFVDSCRWVKIESLGEWVLLLNQFTSQAFSTKESSVLGFRANCIYQQKINSIVYSMEDESFLNIQFPRSNLIPTRYRLQIYWFLAQSW